MLFLLKYVNIYGSGKKENVDDDDNGKIRRDNSKWLILYLFLGYKNKNNSQQILGLFIQLSSR